MNTLFEFAYTPYVLPLVLALILLAFILAKIWRFRSSPLGRTFLYMIIALLIWTLGSTVEMLAVHLDAKVFWGDPSYLGIFPIPIIWLSLVLRFTGRAKKIRSYVIFFSIPAAITALFMLTNNIHHLFRQPSLDCTSGPFCVTISNYGPIFYINALFSYIVPPQVKMEFWTSKIRHFPSPQPKL